MGKIFIGTSGWSYQHWQNVFYPRQLHKVNWLAFYARHFQTVEINVSFYHLPKRKTFTNWRKKVGEKFVFSVKGSRLITHLKRLKDCQEALTLFFQAAEGLKRGNDVILWQLPPAGKFNPERLTAFVKLLPNDWRYAFELRNETWLNEECFQILKKNKMAVVFQDFEYWPQTRRVTADFVYIRLHGKRELYASCYTKKELEDWAKKINNWKKQNLDVYCYFNNDMKGFAIKNARELNKLLC